MYTVYSDILSGILASIYSDILSGLLSDTLPDILSGILSGMCSGRGTLNSIESARDMEFGSRGPPLRDMEFGQKEAEKKRR